MTVAVNWVGCQENTWCDLLTINLNDSRFNNLEGIYIIWHGGPEPSVVCIGQGTLKYRFAAHREDRGVLAYGHAGLYVTWTQVASDYCAGIERFLAEKLRPKLGTYFSDVLPIEVNLPWPVHESKVAISICHLQNLKAKSP